MIATISQGKHKRCISIVDNLRMTAAQCTSAVDGRTGAMHTLLPLNALLYRVKLDATNEIFPCTRACVLQV
uniref:Uncharacterized protein n=1 Tax=Rhizophora mucronata TaxID=61149 RepID=A0A2P2M8M5_RHIMU